MQASDVNVNSTFGSLFLGGVATSMFYGLTCLQTFTYFQLSSRNDTLKFKLLIIFLWTLQTAHLVILLHCLYYYLVTTHGTSVLGIKPIWSLSSQLYFTSIGDFFVQILFIRRIWQLCNNPSSKSPKRIAHIFLILIIFLGASYSLVAGCVYATRGLLVRTEASTTATFSEFFEMDKEAPILYSGLGAQMFADVLIAVALCVLLAKNKTGYKKTDTLVTNLIVFVINTGMLTSFIAGACFVTHLIWPHNFIFMGIFFVLGSAYYNSLLASLNARPVFRARLGSVSPILISPTPSYEFNRMSRRHSE